MQKDSPKDQEKQKTQEVGGFWSYVPSMFTASSSPASASESSSGSSSSLVNASESSSSSSSSSSIFGLNSTQLSAAGGSAVVGGVFAVAGAPVIGAGVVVGGAAAGIYYFGSAMASVGSKIASAVSTAVSTSQPKLTMQEELQIRYQQIQAVNAARGEKIADRETIVANYKTNTQKNSSGNYEFTGNFSHIQNFFDEESKELIGQESGHHDD